MRLAFFGSAILLGVTFSLPSRADPKIECPKILRAEIFEYARRLYSRNSSIAKSLEVLAEQRRLRRLGIPATGQPIDAIASFLEVLEKTTQRARVDERVKERLRLRFYDLFVVRPEDVPESYFESQLRLARDRGHGRPTLTPEARAAMIQVLISDQRKSLDAWYDYLLSDDTAHYPFYIKHWNFTSVVKLAKLDENDKLFLKRSRSTIAPFPELNSEALAMVNGSFLSRIRTRKAEFEVDPEIERLLDQADFGRLYARELIRFKTDAKKIAGHSKEISGTWIRYPRGSDPTPLVKSLEGKATGWCTANHATAAKQLYGGDFYVFYSVDHKQTHSTPRVAIRMSGDKIAEVRGVAKDQNLDEEIAGAGIVKKKMEEFGDEGRRYEIRDENMRRLTEIDLRFKSTGAFTRDDLKFLYEVDARIEGFGRGVDPRIAELLEGRNSRVDIATALGLRPEQISLTAVEASDPKVIYHYGSLDLNKARNGVGLHIPKFIQKSLFLGRISSAKDLHLPVSVGDSLFLSDLTSALELRLPERIGKELNLRGLKSAVGLHLPEKFSGDLDLSGLPSIEGLFLPDSFAGTLELSGLAAGTSIAQLKIPRSFKKIYLPLDIKGLDALGLHPSQIIVRANGIEIIPSSGTFR